MTIQDSTHSIARSAKHFFSGTLISRASGLIREVMMAACFGTDPAVAAFWMAFRFAHLMRRLFGEGALNTVFVPHFERLRKQDAHLSAKFFYELSLIVALLLFFLTFLAEALLGFVLLAFPVASHAREVIHLTMLMLPALVFICLYALNSTLLNCERSYFWPSVAPTAVNLIWVASLLFLKKQPILDAMEHLAILLVIAFIIQWMTTLPPLLNYLSTELKDSYLNTFTNWWKARTWRELNGLLKPFGLGLIGVTAVQINSALDTLFARLADPQGPAYLWYALRLQQLPFAFFGVGLMSALLPPIARALERNEIDEYQHFLYFALKRALLLIIPVTAALFAMGFSAINLIYGHGLFSEGAIRETSFCLWGYASGLVPMTWTLVLAAAFYAQKNYKTPSLLSLFSVLCNFILNALFVFVFHWGAASVAWATSLSAVFNAWALLKALPHPPPSLRSLRPFCIKITSASLSTLLLTAVTSHFLFQKNALQLLGTSFTAFPHTLFSQLLLCSSQAVLFCLFFLLNTLLLRIEEIFNLLEPITTFFKRILSISR